MSHIRHMIHKISVLMHQMDVTASGAFPPSSGRDLLNRINLSGVSCKQEHFKSWSWIHNLNQNLWCVSLYQDDEVKVKWSDVGAPWNIRQNIFRSIFHTSTSRLSITPSLFYLTGPLSLSLSLWRRVSLSLFSSLTALLSLSQPLITFSSS